MFGYTVAHKVYAEVGFVYQHQLGVSDAAKLHNGLPCSRNVI